MPDWSWFEEYIENPPPYSPRLAGEAYSDLKALLGQHSCVKTASTHIKIEWDEEISTQLKLCSRPTSRRTGYSRS